MKSRFQLALQDGWNGISKWRVWLLLGWQDIRIRYRRSFLGPFWITLSMGIIIATMGMLYGHLFKVNLHEYLPFLAGGMLAWSFISTMVVESPNVFVDSHLFLKQVKMPYTIFLMRLITRNVIIFLHNLLVVVPVIIFLHVAINWSLLAVIWAVFIIATSAFFFALILGSLNARYRDVNPITNSIVQICFFLSPIMWPPQNLPEKYAYLVKFNPVAQYVALIREPLLGQWPNSYAFYFTLIFTLISGALAAALFTRTRHRLVFWL